MLDIEHLAELLSEKPTCPTCASQDVEPSEADGPCSFTSGKSQYVCNECVRRDRKAALNVEVAQRMETPPNCYGCNYCRTVDQAARESQRTFMAPRDPFPLYGPGPDNYGRDRWSQPKVFIQCCSLYDRDLCGADETPKPLTRFCYTWDQE